MSSQANSLVKAGSFELKANSAWKANKQRIETISIGSIASLSTLVSLDLNIVKVKRIHVACIIS